MYSFLQKCDNLDFESFKMDRQSNGLYWSAKKIAFVIGRHETGDGETMDPYWNGNSAAIAQIVFETTIGRKLHSVDPSSRLPRLPDQGGGAGGDHRRRLHVPGQLGGLCGEVLGWSLLSSLAVLRGNMQDGRVLQKSGCCIGW